MRLFSPLGVLMAAGLTMTCGEGVGQKVSDVWIVERDMPQTRNLIPVLNRSTLVAAGPGTNVTASIGWTVDERQIEPGRFWPNFGRRALMSAPVLIPEGFPSREPEVLGEPEALRSGDKKEGGARGTSGPVLLKWKDIRLAAGQGAAAHGDVLLGPPDMFHTATGLRFGDIEVRTDYRAEPEKTGEGRVRIVCRLTVVNAGAVPVEDLDFAFFFPRALLDNVTGGELPLLGDFDYEAGGFDDARPLDLLVTDGRGQAAWGPRASFRRTRLGPGESVECELTATGAPSPKAGEEIVIVPLVSIVARVASRYWPSSVVEVEPPGTTHYSEYTHFNLVVADSREFRIGWKAMGAGERAGARAITATVEPSSPLVRRSLGWD